MSCNIVVENMSGIISGELPPTVRADCEQHIMRCSDCRDALHGAQALALLKGRDTGVVPDGLFDSMVDKVMTASEVRPGHRGFWLGTGFGSAVAASILALALALGWIGPAADVEPVPAQFAVALSEPRIMEVAIETDKALADAKITILLSGGIELDGYGNRRELSWTTNLEAGVNRLSLPVMAVDPAGGQMVVRLDHPDTEQIFVVQLDAGA